MGRGPASDQGPVEGSIARVFDRTGQVVGAAFLIGPTQVVTCAYVVTDVLGGGTSDSVPPSGELTIDFPLLGSGHRTIARVCRWWSVDVAGAGGVAVLELAEAPPAPVQVLPMYRPDRLTGHGFRVLGFPSGMEDGVWSSGEIREEEGAVWPRLRGRAHSQPITWGFSGSPVWDDEVDAVVGMAVEANGTSPGLLIPIQHVLGVDPGLLPNPYRGLAPFGEEHADVFCGRDGDIDRLAMALEQQPLVAVLGPSGTGKSSLVRAGLLPRLRRVGVLFAEFRPSPAVTPRMSLASALAAITQPAFTGNDRRREAERVDAVLAGGDAGVRQIAGQLAERADEHGIVLFADQFEEWVSDRAETDQAQVTTPAQELLRLLVELVRAAAALRDGQTPMRVVLTLRWEAMNELLTEDVTETFDHGTVSVTPMGRDQLREAVIGPARRAPGLYFEEGLVERILDDAVDEPGQLPLVESLLTQLWDSRGGGIVTVSAYERLGGVKGAVTKHAENAIERLGDDVDPASLRRLFTMLTRPVEGAAFIRRAVQFKQLRPEHQRIADSLIKSRLVVAGPAPDGGYSIELAHQALIDYWPRLRAWLDEDRDFLLWQEHLDHQLVAWESSERDHGTLLRGTALARAEKWLAIRAEDISQPRKEFVRASRSRRLREVRRRRGILSGLAVMFVFALVFGSLFFYQQEVSRQEEASATSRNLAALSADTAQSDPAWSMMLALAAYRSDPTSEAENALFRHYLNYRGTQTVLSGARGKIRDIDASRDGRVVAARSEGGIVTVWARQPGQPLTMRHLQPGTQAFIVDVADDGRGILLVEEHRTSYYDLATNTRVREIEFEGKVRLARLRDDGAIALSIEGNDFNRAQLWTPDGDGSRLVGEHVVPVAHKPRVLGFGSDPSTVVIETVVDKTGEESTSDLMIWNAKTGTTRTIVTNPSLLGPVGQEYIGQSGFAVLCDHGKAAGGNLSPGSDVTSYTLVVISLRDGSEQRRIPLPKEVRCGTRSVYNADDLAVLNVGSDNSVAVDLRTGRLTPQPPMSQSSNAGGLVAAFPIISDGQRSFTLSHDDSRVLVTEVVTGQPRTKLGQLSVMRGELTPDGRHVVGVLNEGELLDLMPMKVAVTSTDHNAEMVATAPRPVRYLSSRGGDLAISGDSALVADRVADNRVQIRKLPGLELVSEVKTPPAPNNLWEDPDVVANLMFDGDRLLTTVGATAQWWDPLTGEKLAELDLHKRGIVGKREDVRVLTPYADPSRVAVVLNGKPNIQVLEIATGRQVEDVRVGDQVSKLSFQRGGPYFALERRGGLVEVWNLEERRQVLETLHSDGLQQPLSQFLAEPGRFVFGDNGRVNLYHAGSTASERSLQLGRDRVMNEAMNHKPHSVSADGQVLLYSKSTGDMEVVRLELDEWRRRICGLLSGREFTSEERALLPANVGAEPLC